MKSIPRKPYRWFVVAICLLLPACLIQPLGQGSSKAAPAEQTQKDATKTLVDGDEKPDAEVIDRAFLVKWAQVAAEQDQIGRAHV